MKFPQNLFLVIVIFVIDLDAKVSEIESRRVIIKTDLMRLFYIPEDPVFGTGYYQVQHIILEGRTSYKLLPGNFLTQK